MEGGKEGVAASNFGLFFLIKYFLQLLFTAVKSSPLLLYNLCILSLCYCSSVSMLLGGPAESCRDWIHFIISQNNFLVLRSESTQDIGLLTFRHKLLFAMKFGVFMIYIKCVFLKLLIQCSTIANFYNFTIFYHFISILSYLDELCFALMEMSWTSLEF